jgi:cytoskeleton protein RodZ
VTEEAVAPVLPTPPPAAPLTIGERLRIGRERLAFTVPAVAEKLHLDPKVIEALESNRFAEIGASVYVRGHLRRYAEFVGESANDLIAAYAARSEARPPPPDLTQIPHAERRSDPRRLVTPLVGLGCAAVLAIAIWWVLAGSRSGANAPVVSAGPDDAVTETAVPLPTAAPELPVPQPQVTPPATPAAASATNAGTNSLLAGNKPGEETKREEPAPRDTRLKLELTTDSWIEVYDARGERLFYDVASAGSVQSVAGRPPLRVVLGNSAGVTVEVNGERREIPAAAADGEGARFVVNRSGSLSRAR